MNRRGRLIGMALAAVIASGAGWGTSALLANGPAVSGAYVTACYRSLPDVAYQLQHGLPFGYVWSGLHLGRTAAWVMREDGDTLCKNVPRSLVDAEIVKLFQDKPHSLL